MIPGWCCLGNNDRKKITLGVCSTNSFPWIFFNLQLGESIDVTIMDKKSVLPVKKKSEVAEKIKFCFDPLTPACPP